MKSLDFARSNGTNPSSFPAAGVSSGIAVDPAVDETPPDRDHQPTQLRYTLSGYLARAQLQACAICLVACIPVIFLVLGHLNLPLRVATTSLCVCAIGLVSLCAVKTNAASNHQILRSQIRRIARSLAAAEVPSEQIDSEHPLFQELLIIQAAARRKMERQAVRNRDLVHLADALEADMNELSAAQQLAEHDSRSKSMFLMKVGHEVRTPLNNLLGVNELLAETDLNSEQNSLVSSAQASAKDLLHLLDGVIEYTRLDEGVERLVEDPLEVRLMLSQIVDQAELDAANQNVKLDVSISEEIPAVVAGDAAKISEVLSTLIHYAITSASSVSGHVKLSIEELVNNQTEFAQFQFLVSHNGQRISDDDRARLFEPFEHLQTKGKDVGEGLSLALCLSKVQAMGGQLQVENLVGVGPTFRVTLPLKTVDLSALDSPMLSFQASDSWFPEGDGNSIGQDTGQHFSQTEIPSSSGSFVAEIVPQVGFGNDQIFGLTRRDEFLDRIFADMERGVQGIRNLHEGIMSAEQPNPLGETAGIGSLDDQFATGAQPFPNLAKENKRGDPEMFDHFRSDHDSVSPR
jgi:signal transduction histidine kinase